MLATNPGSQVYKVLFILFFSNTIWIILKHLQTGLTVRRCLYDESNFWFTVEKFIILVFRKSVCFEVSFHIIFILLKYENHENCETVLHVWWALDSNLFTPVSRNALGNGATKGVYLDKGALYPFYKCLWNQIKSLFLYFTRQYIFFS